jgi:hypothetical protein
MGGSMRIDEDYLILLVVLKSSIEKGKESLHVTNEILLECGCKRTNSKESVFQNGGILTRGGGGKHL